LAKFQMIIKQRY